MWQQAALSLRVAVDYRQDRPVSRRQVHFGESRESIQTCLRCQVPGGCQRGHALCGLKRDTDGGVLKRSAGDAVVDRQAAVVDWLRASGPASLGELVSGLGEERLAVRYCLRKLREAGRVALSGVRLYRVVDDGAG